MRWLDGITDSMDTSWSKLRDREGQGNLACCSPRCHKESDLTEQLNNSHSVRQMKHGPSQSVHNFLKFYRNMDAGNCL